jgi:hypothetical protein
VEALKTAIPLIDETVPPLMFTTPVEVFPTAIPPFAETVPLLILSVPVERLLISKPDVVDAAITTLLSSETPSSKRITPEIEVQVVVANPVRVIFPHVGVSLPSNRINDVLPPPMSSTPPLPS